MLKRLLRHHLVQNVLVLYGVQITGYVFPLITLSYLARVLGPGRFGLLALGGALTGYFAKLAIYGFDITGTRAVAVVAGDAKSVWHVYSTIMACRAALMAASLPVLVAIVFATPQFRAYYPLYLINILAIVGLGLSPNWLFQGLQRMKFVAWSDYGAKVVSLGLIFLLVRSSSDYLLAAAIQAGAFTVAACIGLAFAFVVLKVRLVRPAWAGMRRAMSEASPVFFSNVATGVIHSTNTVLLGVVSTPDEVGCYDAAVRLVVAAGALTAPFFASFYPHMSILAAKSPAHALSFFRRRVLWVAAPFLLGSAVLYLAAPEIVRIIYGPRFAEAALLLRVLALSPFLTAISVCFSGCYMLPFGYERKSSGIIGSAMLFHLALLAPLCYLWGPAVGVAASLTASEGFRSLSFALFYYRSTTR